jgi:group I intron endonuclease
MPIDYSKGKVYKITNDVNNELYIGSTIKTLSQRMAKHRQDSKQERCQNYKIYKAFEEIGVEHFKIVLLEECLCVNRDQLRAKEDHYIQLLKPAYNMISAVLNLENQKKNRAEHYDTNKDDILTRNKEYYNANADKILKQKAEYYAENQKDIIEKSAAYYETNKEQIKIKKAIYDAANKEKISARKSEKVVCECGLESTRGMLSRHRKTKTHLEIMQKKK